MKQATKACLVGAGGIGCAILPLLSRMMDVVIIDADNYEPKNAGRQFPALTSTENKAKALWKLTQPHTLYKLQWMDCYVMDSLITNRPEWSGVDLIIGAVDNNKSRHILTQLANDLEIPAILAGNEHEHGEAHLVAPGIYNPMDHYDFPATEPVPWGCNTDDVVEEFPQTPIANFLAAGCAAHILLSWNKVKNPMNAIAHSRADGLLNSFARVKEKLLTSADA